MPTRRKIVFGKSDKSCAESTLLVVLGNTRLWRRLAVACFLVYVFFLLLSALDTSDLSPEPIPTGTRPIRARQAPRPKQRSFKIWDKPPVALFSEVSELIERANTRLQGQQRALMAPNVDDQVLASCSRNATWKNTKRLPKFSLIYSLCNLKSADEALFLLQRSLKNIPDNLTDDVLITMDKGAPEDVKQTVEDATDLCGMCRLFFVRGTIYRHRNFAVNFAHYSAVVFVDPRVVPGGNWLPPLVSILLQNPRSVVSPHIRLCNSTGSVCTVGASWNEISWDLGVVRGPLTADQIYKIRKSGKTFVNQTAISKEVFAIEKDFFKDLLRFDIIRNASGGEDVSFSLKVLNSGGNVIMSLCSQVFFIQGDKPSISNKDIIYDPQGDFFNPSFQYPKQNVSIYFDSFKQVWLDSFSNRYYTCCKHRKVNGSEIPLPQNKLHLSRSYRLQNYLFLHFGTHALKVKGNLRYMHCEFTNFRYIVAKRQPHMLSPTKHSTFYGYLKTHDSLFGFGLPETGKQPQLSSSVKLNSADFGHFLLTRNATLWIGPFSYTNGAFIFGRVWCLTLTKENNLTLTKCVKGTKAQLFAYTGGTIKPAEVVDKCAGAKMTEQDVSLPLTMRNCSDGEIFKHFKFDIEFNPSCVR